MMVDARHLLHIVTIYLLTASVVSADNAVWMTHTADLSASSVDDDDDLHSQSAAAVERLRRHSDWTLRFQRVTDSDVPHGLRREFGRAKGAATHVLERTGGVSELNGYDAAALSDWSVDDNELADTWSGASVPQVADQQTGGIRRLPQAIIIGVKKGGTRALLEFLRIHPHVRAPGPEVHFFDRHYGRGLDWYRSQMPRSVGDQITIEKTPSYFVTKLAPDRIYNMSRDIRLIVVVRDPVTRAISDYVQAAAKRPELPAFERMALVDTANGTQHRFWPTSTADVEGVDTRQVATSWGAVKIGIYARHLRRWLRRFPRDRIHLVNGERLITDPASEMAVLQDFLRLPRFVDARHFYFNATKGFPCLRKSVATAPAKASRGAAEKEVVRCLGKSKGRSHPDIDSKVIQRLRDFFRPYNEKFYRMTGINFEWP